VVAGEDLPRTALNPRTSSARGADRPERALGLPNILVMLVEASTG
jgi:hypothetical protein